MKLPITENDALLITAGVGAVVLRLEVLVVVFCRLVVMHLQVHTAL
jgi:hypothetical protein